MISSAIALVLGILSAQPTPAESEQFEVASIRPGNGARIAMEFTPGGGVRAANVTLKLLIQIAYDIRTEQLSGGPGWSDSEQYTLVAKGPEGGSAATGAAQQELMRKRLRALLKERFHLTLKHEETAARGYGLTLTRNGPRMTVSKSTEGRLRQVGRWEVRAEGATMATLTRFLSVHLSRTVVDRTGLEGHYDLHIIWTPPTPDWSDEAAGDALRTAVEQQLGLRLEPEKTVSARYWIERAEKPTEN